MVSVLHANLISCRVGFVLSCFYKSNFSSSLSWRERYSREIASTCQIQLVRLKNILAFQDRFETLYLKSFKIKRWKVTVIQGPQGKSDPAKHWPMPEPFPAPPPKPGKSALGTRLYYLFSCALKLARKYEIGH